MTGRQRTIESVTWLPSLISFVPNERQIVSMAGRNSILPLTWIRNLNGCVLRKNKEDRRFCPFLPKHGDGGAASVAAASVTVVPSVLMSHRGLKFFLLPPRGLNRIVTAPTTK